MLVYCEDGPLNGKKLDVDAALLLKSVEGSFEGRKHFRHAQANATYVESRRSWPNLAEPDPKDPDVPVYVFDPGAPGAERARREA